MTPRQSAQSVLMVSPASFAFDTQTAESNAFQVRLQAEPSAVTKRALDEFWAAVESLRQAGIAVVAHDGAASEDKPNAVFPNNWISMWPDGTVFTYPMATASRRSERDAKVLAELADQFEISKVIDLSDSEAAGHYLESTGVIVFDHLAKIAYGCISERCDEVLFISHVQALGYRPITFHAFDQAGVPIYHTNVMMAVQSTTAVICTETIADAKERQQVLQALQQNHEVIDISFAQMNSFCGNVLEVESSYGEKYLVLSQTAHDALTEAQRALLSADKKLLPISIPTIELVGGGSARCMLAEIFLQPALLPQNQLAFDAPREAAAAEVV